LANIAYAADGCQDYRQVGSYIICILGREGHNYFVLYVLVNMFVDS